MKNCEICNSKFGLLNAKFELDDGHVICTKCQNKLGFWFKPDEAKYKAIPFEQVMKSYQEKTTVNDVNNQDDRVKNPHSTQTNTLVCPNCQSTDVSFVQNNKKAFSLGKAAAGATLTGGIGTLAGFAGKKGNNQWHCKNCGQLFETRK